MPDSRPARPFLGFDDEERVPVRVLVFRFPPCRGLLLTADLGTGDVDRTQVLSTTLSYPYLSVFLPDTTYETHALIVLQDCAPKDKVSRLPSSKILPSLGEVPFLVIRVHHRSTLDNIRTQEHADLIPILRGQCDQTLDISLQLGLPSIRFRRSMVFEQFAVGKRRELPRVRLWYFGTDGSVYAQDLRVQFLHRPRLP